MDTQAQTAGPETTELDREVFAQVWSRVAPGGDGPVEVSAPPAALPGQDGAGRTLQELVLACLTDAATYRDLTRRSRRCRRELLELAERKTRQAKRLSAAYFLHSGVRYWPSRATPVQPPEGFFVALRRRFFAEEALAARLGALAEEAGEGYLKALYLALAGEAEELALAIRQLVERET